MPTDQDCPKRITPEQVVAAYAATRLKPTQGFWINPSATCACGLGALIATRQKYLDRGMTWDDAAIKLGVPIGYVRSFTLGFDGVSRNCVPDHIEGFDDGRAAAMAVGLIADEKGDEKGDAHVNA